MSTMKVTILGFEDYLNHKNDSLFKDIKLPPGLDIHKDTLVNEILLHCAEFEVTYANPFFMKDATTNFFNKNYLVFKKWWEGVIAEYNPIENTDRYEEWTDEGNRSQENTSTDTTVASDVSEVNGGGTTTRDVTTYDSESYKHDNQVSSTSGSTSEASTEGSSDKHHEGTEEHFDKHVGHVHGNIGTMTAAQLLEGHYEISRFNIFEQIADLYMLDFCIGVYW